MSPARGGEAGLEEGALAVGADLPGPPHAGWRQPWGGRSRAGLFTQPALWWLSCLASGHLPEVRHRLWVRSHLRRVLLPLPEATAQACALGKG